MKKEEKNFDSILIILAGCLWGSMGIFVRKLGSFHFNSIQIVSIRVTLAALLFSVLLFIKNRSGFRISLRDLPLFLGLGLGSILFFTVCYFTAINMMSLSTAAILLYTSPVWIMLMSVLFFHEKMSGRKIFALVLAFGGCVLVSGISGEKMTVTGLLVGLGSGLGYGLYSILGTVALRRYSPYTVTTYTFIFAAIGSWFISRPADMISKFSDAPNTIGLIMFCFLTALITAFIPFLAYTLGLRTVEASKAGIIATIEPLVATLIGVVVFKEALTVLSALGIILILAAVIILNCKKEKRRKKMNIAYIILKVIMIILIVYFATDAVMQHISYSFYKGDQKIKNVVYEPVEIQIRDSLFGYGYNLDSDSDKVILFFGGSKYIAYNSAGMYGGRFDCPFLSVDYYGTQKSKGKMKLDTMQQSAEELYDYARSKYPDKDIYVFGHSYGCGMAAYLASVRECKHLVLASGYRTCADLYNKIIPIFWGPLQVFIKNNIRVDQYAKDTSCPVTVIGSDYDKTLDAGLQKKLAACYDNAECRIFKGIKHEDYFVTDEVIRFIVDDVFER